MTLRSLRPDDIPVLEGIAAENGYEYLDIHSPRIEAISVVTDEGGKIIAAAAAERIVQLFLWAAPENSAQSRLNAIRLLHEGMASKLRQKGFTEANIFLPAAIEKTFGNCLKRRFAWRPNLASLFLRF